ncbi:MAG: hypothetical protein RR387_03255 [Clostridiales bacterium]
MGDIDAEKIEMLAQCLFCNDIAKCVGSKNIRIIFAVSPVSIKKDIVFPSGKAMSFW